MNKLVLSPNQLVKLQDRGNMNKLLYITAILLAIVSCSPQIEQVGTPFVAGQEVALSASMPGRQTANHLPGKQRISGKDTNPTDPTQGEVALSWDEGDQVLVTVGDKSAVFTLSSGAGTNNATFTGTMPADGSEFSVSYPVDYSDDVLMHQTYVENGFGNGLMKMSTKQNGTLDNGFVLSADNAVLGLQLTGNQTLGKIVLTNLSNEATYTLHCEGVVLKAAEATMFYIVVPVEGWEDGMGIEVLDNNGVVILRKEKTGTIAFDAKEAMVMPSLEASGPEKRIGVFSVGEGKYVSFSQGNLQYTQSTDTWQFAKNQWEYIGADNVKDGGLADKIDLFGWSTDNVASPWGVLLTTNNQLFVGNFVDWGINVIQGGVANTWRTLSFQEWKYLLKERNNASQLYAFAMVDTINGLIVLPDDWQPIDGMSLIMGNNSSSSIRNSLTFEQWERLEIANAVFLPAAGVLMGTKHNHPTSGLYWSATANDDDAYSLYLPNNRYVYVDYSCQRSTHRSVRLVHDTIIPFEPESVDLGLSVMWATCNVGATTPEEYGDLFAWGETEPKEVYGWNTYKWCNGTENNMTKYNATDGLTTLLPEDDAAHVNWGGQWRMPSDVEMSELISDCTWELITKNGVKGYQITSKVEGYLDLSIFWPCAGYLNHDLNNIVSASARYWTNKCNGSKACNLYEFETIMYNTRRCGCSIRPVLPKN